MILDARSVPEDETIEADVCVVGAGIAGIALAREFIGEEIRVCLVESGGLVPDKVTQSLYWGENVGHPYYPLDTHGARCFGGTSHRWHTEIGRNRLGVRLRPLDEIDFEERDWVPYSGWPFNKSHLDLPVTFVEYWEIGPKGTQHFTWVTDLPVTTDNVYQIMRGGRARWRIENETFNTLKNQGYHFGHNYGLGKQHLAAVFATLMMLAFLVDQIQQLCCPLFQAVWAKLRTKRALWQAMRALFGYFLLESMTELYRALWRGIIRKPPELLDSS